MTRLLRRWQGGDEQAYAALHPLIYDELRRQAGRMLRREGRAVTLQPTALVHESLIRLFPGEAPVWESEGHFRALMAKVMRRVLVDFARKRRAEKRGGDEVHVTLDGSLLAGNRPVEIERLDEALRELADVDLRAAQVVDLRFFGGFEVKEVADHLGISEPTVKRDWRAARLWLLRYLGDHDP